MHSRRVWHVSGARDPYSNCLIKSETGGTNWGSQTTSTDCKKQSGKVAWPENIDVRAILRACIIA